MKPSRLPYGLIAPSAIFLIVLFVWPLVETGLMAFRSPQGQWTDAYVLKMWGDLNFSRAMKNTLMLYFYIHHRQMRGYRM